jgi:flagellar biosynthetic protein FlhB
VLPTVAPLLAVVVVTAIAGSAVQGGIHVSTKKLKPTFKQFNLLAGVKRLFGAQSWWQGGKSLLKTVVIGAVLASVAKSIAPVLLASGGLSLQAVVDVATGGVGSLLRTAVMAGLALAVVDVVFVSKQNRKKTRMTLKEVKDEHKSSEGDPLLKGAIRSKQMAMSRNRMMAAVADADVVLVNPTHVAVALTYEPGTGAPRVVAKGAGHVAARIRSEANDKRVPLVEDIPLARALHAACELGQEIPSHLFTQVAKVLAFVMQLRRRGAAQGVHRVPERRAA